MVSRAVYEAINRPPSLDNISNDNNTNCEQKQSSHIETVESGTRHTVNGSDDEEMLVTAIRRHSKGKPQEKLDSPARSPPSSAFSEYEGPQCDPELSKFQSILRRNVLLKEQTSRDPARSYANLRLTPINVDSGVWQILSSAPGSNTTTFKWDYSLVSSGPLTYTWSLVKIGGNFDRVRPFMRPIGTLETSGRHIKLSSAMITDLTSVYNACSIELSHYYDSWAMNGFHVAFQIDKDYRYEWQSQEDMPGYSQSESMLWRTNSNTKLHEPAGRSTTQDSIQHPMDHKKELWCLDIDVDRIKPHIAILSAMSMKVSHPKWHAWFAKKTLITPPSSPLVNFAFQDEGHIYQPSGKFWGDWEEEQQSQDGVNSFTEVRVIQVFNKSHMQQFAISPKSISMSKKEASKRVALIKSKCAIYD